MIKRGRGMACMWYPIGFTVAANPSAATVKVNTDGTATVLTGTVDAFKQHLGPNLANRVVAMNPGDTVSWTEGGTAT